MPVNDFKWDKEISGFNEDFIKSYNDYSDEGWRIFEIDKFAEKLKSFQTSMVKKNILYIWETTY